MTIKQKLHRILFPEQEKTIEGLEKACSHWHEVFEKKNTLARELQETLDDFKKSPRPMMSDLMRQVLGLTTIDFTNVDKQGIPPHFLESASKGDREKYVSELHQIFQTEVWPVMCKNHIDTQGNFSFRNADGELQMLAGRMSVNGISLLANEVRKGHEEYQERSKKPEEFDEFETTEGVPIKNINQ